MYKNSCRRFWCSLCVALECLTLLVHILMPRGPLKYQKKTFVLPPDTRALPSSLVEGP